MKGWKTWLGTSLVAIGSGMVAFATVVPELEIIGQLLIGLGAALTGIGIAHKVEKAKG